MAEVGHQSLSSLSSQEEVAEVEWARQGPTAQDKLNWRFLGSGCSQGGLIPPAPSFEADPPISDLIWLLGLFLPLSPTPGAAQHPRGQHRNPLIDTAFFGKLFFFSSWFINKNLKQKPRLKFCLWRIKVQAGKLLWLITPTSLQPLALGESVWKGNLIKADQILTKLMISIFIHTRLLWNYN